MKKHKDIAAGVMVVVWIVVFLLLAMEGLRSTSAQDAYTLPPIVRQHVSTSFTQLTGQPVPYLGMRSVTTNAKACLAVGQFGAVAPVNGYFVSVKLNGIEFRYYSTPAGAVKLCNVNLPTVKQ